jgi:sugar phosphate isomerase/epimerase
MNRIKIGVRLESLELPFRKALQAAARMDVTGVQFDAVGDLSPHALSDTGRREVRNLLKANNLELTALGCPLRRGLDSPEDQQARIDRVRKVLSLSFELGPRVVIVQAGKVPVEPADESACWMNDAMQALGQFGDRVGAVLALETGLEPGAELSNYLSRFDSGGLGVNLDPANLLMNGFDPVQSARALRGRIVHAHAHDARKSSASRTAQEVALGHGDIDWMAYLGLLEEIEYRGWLVVERESGENRLADVANGVALLKRFGV